MPNLATIVAGDMRTLAATTAALRLGTAGSFVSNLATVVAGDTLCANLAATNVVQTHVELGLRRCLADIVRFFVAAANLIQGHFELGLRRLRERHAAALFVVRDVGRRREGPVIPLLV